MDRWDLQDETTGLPLLKRIHSRKFRAARKVVNVMEVERRQLSDLAAQQRLAEDETPPPRYSSFILHLVVELVMKITCLLVYTKGMLGYRVRNTYRSVLAEAVGRGTLSKSSIRLGRDHQTTKSRCICTTRHSGRTCPYSLFILVRNDRVYPLK